MVVFDANIVLRGLRSRNGASHLILKGMLGGRIAFAVSTAFMLEYEDLLKRTGILGPNPWISPNEIDVILDALCAVGSHVAPRYRFRPFLADPKDDLSIDCAMAAGARTIVTEDRHFQHPDLPVFGIRPLGASAFLATQPALRR